METTITDEVKALVDKYISENEFKGESRLALLVLALEASEIGLKRAQAIHESVYGGKK